jgi:hypothetical protein
MGCLVWGWRGISWYSWNGSVLILILFLTLEWWVKSRFLGKLEGCGDMCTLRLPEKCKYGGICALFGYFWYTNKLVIGQPKRRHRK